MPETMEIETSLRIIKSSDNQLGDNLGEELEKDEDVSPSKVTPG